LLEAPTTIGGGTRSAELTLPGFVHDLCSAVHPLAACSPVFAQLNLARSGFEWVEPEIPLAHPFEDGTAAVLRRTVEETAAGLGADGNAYSRLMDPLVQNWTALANEFLRPLLHVPRHPVVLARFGLKSLRSAERLARSYFREAPARACSAGLLLTRSFR
jgi:phytoene dehydrogenase-like protein